MLAGQGAPKGLPFLPIWTHMVTQTFHVVPTHLCPLVIPACPSAPRLRSPYAPHPTPPLWLPPDSREAARCVSPPAPFFCVTRPVSWSPPLPNWERGPSLLPDTQSVANAVALPQPPTLPPTVLSKDLPFVNMGRHPHSSLEGPSLHLPASQPLPVPTSGPTPSGTFPQADSFPNPPPAAGHTPAFHRAITQSGATS